MLTIAALCCLAAPPHIVVYLSDDHSALDCGVYHDSGVAMPRLAALAEQGTTFTHAFVASPACAPSRAAILTGLMPARNGAEANHTYPKPGTHYLVKDLNAAGYTTAAFGKVFHGRDAEPYDFDHVELPSAVDRLRVNVRKYLSDYDSERPLCLFVGTSNPHVPWTAGPRVAPSEINLPPRLLDTPATRAHRSAFEEEVAELDELLGDLREMTAERLGEDVLFIHTSDHGSQWPFGKWNLTDYGTSVAFVASWPEHVPARRRTDAMISLVDLLPTLVDIAGGSVPDGIDGQSFKPALLGEADDHRERIFLTHTGDGSMNVYPIRAVRTRDWKLVHNLRPDLAHTNHSDLLRKPNAGAYWDEWADQIKTDEAAAAFVDSYFRRPEWELFRVARDGEPADIWELDNLSGQPETAAIETQLRRQLNDWRNGQGDSDPELHASPRPLSEPSTWHPNDPSQREPK